VCAAGRTSIIYNNIGTCPILTDTMQRILPLGMQAWGIDPAPVRSIPDENRREMSSTRGRSEIKRGFAGQEKRSGLNTYFWGTAIAGEDNVRVAT
jgi:hypothetical protein